MVVLGDFNSEEQDSPCWLLRRGRLERNHTDACCPQVGGVGCWCFTCPPSARGTGQQLVLLLVLLTACFRWLWATPKGPVYC